MNVESECRDRVRLNADTQLGAFGPGADIKRAAELRTHHRIWQLAVDAPVHSALGALKFFMP